MIRPPYGLSLPCRFVRARDGDTIEVAFPGSTRVWAIRLIDCWCEETNRGPEETRAKGQEAKAYARKLCEDHAHDMSVLILAPTDPLNLLSALTFDRVPGYIFLSSTLTLNEALVASGHAVKEKPKSCKRGKA